MRWRFRSSYFSEPLAKHSDRMPTESAYYNHQSLGDLHVLEFTWFTPVRCRVHVVLGSSSLCDDGSARRKTEGELFEHAQSWHKIRNLLISPDFVDDKPVSIWGWKISHFSHNVYQSCFWVVWYGLCNQSFPKNIFGEKNFRIQYVAQKISHRLFSAKKVSSISLICKIFSQNQKWRWWYINELDSTTVIHRIRSRYTF